MNACGMMLRLIRIGKNFKTGRKESLWIKENYGNRVAELLMIHIDRSIEITKTKVISNLFKAYVNEEIEYDGERRAVKLLMVPVTSSGLPRKPSVSMAM